MTLSVCDRCQIAFVSFLKASSEPSSCPLLSTTRSLTPCPVSLLWITNLRKVDFCANLMAKLDNELFKKHQDLSGIFLALTPSSLEGDCVSSDAYLTDLVSVTSVKVLNPVSFCAAWFFTGRLLDFYVGFLKLLLNAFVKVPLKKKKNHLIMMFSCNRRTKWLLDGIRKVSYNSWGRDVMPWDTAILLHYQNDLSLSVNVTSSYLPPTEKSEMA